jgi:hypothetical protein
MLLTGRAGLSFGNYYSCSIYNGNDHLTVTEVEITIKTTIGGKEVSTPYRQKVKIAPKTTADFGFNIVVGDPGATYEWTVTGGKGIPQ